MNARGVKLAALRASTAEKHEHDGYEGAGGGGGGAGGGPGERLGAMQRKCGRKLARVYPAWWRTLSENPDPLPFWGAGAQMVALNMQAGPAPHLQPHLQRPPSLRSRPDRASFYLRLQTNDVPMRLHRAFFHRTGGFVLKPKEMREGANTPRSWRGSPPCR